MDNTADPWTNCGFFGHFNNREREKGLAEPAFQRERLVLTWGAPKSRVVPIQGRPFRHRLTSTEKSANLIPRVLPGSPNSNAVSHCPISGFWRKTFEVAL